MHLNLAHLNYVIAVAKSGSITLAAAEVGISQPAISAAIGSMEQALDYKLFVRNRARGLALTPAGRNFVNQAARLLDQAGAFQDEVQGFGDRLVGEIQLACYHVIAPYVLPPIVKALALAHPGLSLRLHEGSLVEVVDMVKDGVADIALTYDMFDDSNVQLERLLPVRPHVLMSAQHPLADQAAVCLRQLAAHPFVMLDIPGVRDYYQTLFRQHKVQPDVRFRAASLELVRSFVGANMGYSFALLPVQSNHSYYGDLVLRKLLSDEVEQAHLALVSPAKIAPPKKVSVFAGICQVAINSAIGEHMKRFQSGDPEPKITI